MNPLELVAELFREHGYRIHTAMEKWEILVLFKEPSKVAICEFCMSADPAEPTKIFFFQPRPRGSYELHSYGHVDLSEPNSLDKALEMVNHVPFAYVTEEDYK